MVVGLGVLCKIIPPLQPEGREKGRRRRIREAEQGLIRGGDAGVSDGEGGLRASIPAIRVPGLLALLPQSFHLQLCASPPPPA